MSGFCYFHIPLNTEPLRRRWFEFWKPPVAYYPWLVATENLDDVVWWVSPKSAQRNPNDRRYWSLSSLQAGVKLVYKGAHMWRVPWPAGQYVIEFTARSGSWVEELTIPEWSIVVRDGTTAEVLYSEGAAHGMG